MTRLSDSCGEEVERVRGVASASLAHIWILSMLPKILFCRQACTWTPGAFGLPPLLESGTLGTLLWVWPSKRLPLQLPAGVIFPYTRCVVLCCSGAAGRLLAIRHTRN